MSFHPLPLNRDAAYISATRTVIASLLEGDLERHDDQTFYDMISEVADGLHMGRLGFEDHNDLIQEIRDAHDKWLDLVDATPSTWMPGDLNAGA